MTRLPLVAVLCVLATPLAAQQQGGKIKEPSPKATTADALSPGDTLVVPEALKARSIGPAVMGGRVAAIAVDPVRSSRFYVGLGTGGIMKTTDDGITFAPIFEKEAVASIGAIAVAPSDTNVVWVGTGEGNDRNTVSWGNGVYRSSDGGGTWTNVGLKASRAIPRIVVHPTDPNTAYVCVIGDLWQASAERGLYKTTDAGATWKAILTAPAPLGNKVGCGDVALDPSNPNTIYAALYARVRRPYSFTSGVAASDGKDAGGIFKSTDGGATWKKLTYLLGLPARTQRIGLAVSAKDPKVVMAVVQSDEAGNTGGDDIRQKSGGTYRSEDGGERWTRVSPLDPRPFYFSQIRIDPTNDQHVYVLGFMLHVSEDGGKTFREDRFKGVHSDNHALEIDPRDPKRLLLGGDGGIYQSYSAGASWEHLTKFAGGEYFRVNADMSIPYRICGGLQDNENWVGPSTGERKDGILDGDWYNIGGGDGSYCAFDPADSSLVYAESQGGFIQRTNLRTGEIRNLRPDPAEGQTAVRFHWTSPFVVSSHEQGTIYYGGNVVFKLTSNGEHWRVISPELSTKDYEKMRAVGSGAEDYGVVYALAESPAKAGVLWAGTDDGKLWITVDDGANWSDLTANLPAAAKGHWVSRIEAGHADAQVAYVAVNGFRDGVYAPLVYRTGDGGKSWQSIAANLPADGPVKVIREDAKNPNLLFAGTEFALWVSTDRGARWARFGGLPTVAIDDIMVHPRDGDLLIATHGRSLYVVDDIRALEELTPDVQKQAAYLFTPRTAHARVLLPGWQDSDGALFRGQNVAEGALLSFYVRRYTGESVSIAITSSTGQPVANLTGPGTPGINRVNWDLRPTKDVLLEYGGEGQKFVRAGEYTVTLTFGLVKQERKLTVEVPEGLETR